MGQLASKLTTKLSATGTTSTATIAKYNLNSNSIIPKHGVVNTNSTAAPFGQLPLAHSANSSGIMNHSPPTNHNKSSSVPDPITGFHRGNVLHEQDVMQNQFHQQKQKESPSVSEMPSDLLRFMKDVGPVTKKEEIESTKQLKKQDDNDLSMNSPSSLESTTSSPSSKVDNINQHVSKPLRIPRHLRHQWEQEKQTDSDGPKDNMPFRDPKRIVSSMRLAKNVDGYFTNRTTSFSYDTTSTHSDDDNINYLMNHKMDRYQYGLYSTHIYQLISSFNHLNDKSNDGNDDNNSDDIQEIASRHYEQTTVKADVDGNHKNNNEQQQQKLLSRQQRMDDTNVELLKNSLRYYENPVIMKDTDDTYVGTSRHNVSLLEQMKLIRMPSHIVTLVLDDIIKTTKQTTSSVPVTNTTISSTTTSSDHKQASETIISSSSL